ncbi:beta-1,3-galactosyltransferase 1-like [Diadema antillarum]|uniref:beta-1,3-galactosyltransferase 1-like n=1 Tax=Diadema antillarum TaxID=105358 RepID=UPI003A8582CE
MLSLLILSMSFTVVCQIYLLYQRSSYTHHISGRQLAEFRRPREQRPSEAAGDLGLTRLLDQVKEEIKHNETTETRTSNFVADAQINEPRLSAENERGNNKSRGERIQSRDFLRKQSREYARQFYAKYAEKLENRKIEVEVYATRSEPERIRTYVHAYKKYNISSKKGTVIVKNKKGETKLLVTSPPASPTNASTTLAPQDADIVQVVPGYKKVDAHKKFYRKKKKTLPVPQNKTLGILNTTEWRTYIDKHEYNYILNPVSKCLTDTGTYKRVALLIFVASAPKNFHRREAIRRTWGMAGRSETRHVETVFLIGAVADQVTQSDLHRELINYGDIVQENFVDSYLNLTVKTVAGFKWASKYCQNAKFVMKTDDDMMVNTVRMLTYLRTAPWKNFMAGKAAFDYDVIRDPYSKFYVPYKVLRQDKYPPYCIGIGYVMSIDVVHKVYLTALQTPIFPWEDVFVGMCLHQLGVVPKLLNGFMGGGFFDDVKGGLKKDLTSMSRLRTTFVIHEIPLKYMDLVWGHWVGLG